MAEKNRFRDWLLKRQVDPSKLTPEQKMDVEKLAQLARPYQSMSEQQLLEQLQRMKQSPEIKQLLQKYSMEDIMRTLAPMLDPQQQVKLQQALKQLGK